MDIDAPAGYGRHQTVKTSPRLMRLLGFENPYGYVWRLSKRANFVYCALLFACMLLTIEALAYVWLCVIISL